MDGKLGLHDSIRTAHSTARDARVAARELHSGLVQPDIALVTFFCSSEYDLEGLADEINLLFPGISVVGCTTAGEIGPSGYLNRSLCGASFPSGACVAAVGHLDHLQQFALSQGRDLAQSLLQQLEGLAPSSGAHNTFALMLIDGLSVREEPVAHAVQHALGTIPMVGGSAGDDLKFARTYVFHDGAFRSDRAVLILLSSTYPFTTFKTQHFARGEARLVVTGADAPNRVVREINALPAAVEYARLTGVAVASLNAEHFSAFPLVIQIDGSDYVRAIQQNNPDGSLTFYCAIEEGLVLRIAHGGDVIANLTQTFDSIRGSVGPPQLVLGCDCILRSLEVSRIGSKGAVAEIFRRNNVVGFSTYGEQYRAVHVNQTFTGVALGSRVEALDG